MNQETIDLDRIARRNVSRALYRDRVHAMAAALASRKQVLNVSQIVRQAREIVQAVDEDLDAHP